MQGFEKASQEYSNVQMPDLPPGNSSFLGH
jgi:hypothetical protein